MEILLLFEQWAGHRLLTEKVTRPHVRPNRPILIPSVPVSEGIEIGHGCQLLSSLFELWPKLPGDIGTFLPPWGWLSYVQVKASWMESVFSWFVLKTLESCHHQCLKAVCGVLGYPKGSASEHLDGTLKLRHCTDMFTMRFTPWSLPWVGNGGGKKWDVTPGHSSDDRSSTVKRVRLNRKTSPAALFSHVPNPGHPTPRMEKIALPFLRRRGG